MRLQFRLVLLLALLAGCQHVREPRPWGTADYSSPRDTMLTFVAAMEAGDRQVMQSCCLARSTGAQDFRLDFVFLSAFYNESRRVLVQRFGKEVAGEQSWVDVGAFPDLRKEIHSLKVEAASNRAVLRDSRGDPAAPPGFPRCFPFRRVRGRWLIDLDADPDIKQYPAGGTDFGMLRLQAFEPEELEASLQEVRAGKYRTFEELEAAQRRQSQARMKRFSDSMKAPEK